MGIRIISLQGHLNIFGIGTKNYLIFGIIESRNGHIKILFKFFDQIIESAHVIHLQDFYQIAAALINRFHPVIQMAGADAELARRMLQRSLEPNLFGKFQT